MEWLVNLLHIIRRKNNKRSRSFYTVQSKITNNKCRYYPCIKNRLVILSSKKSTSKDCQFYNRQRAFYRITKDSRTKDEWQGGTKTTNICQPKTASPNSAKKYPMGGGRPKQ